jgi:hypothetical protein
MGKRPKHLKKSNTFPSLAKKAHSVTSDPDVQYNCIAFAIGRTDKKIWPEFHPDHYWPPGVFRGDAMASLIKLFESEGYVAAKDGKFIAGTEKIAIYAMASSGRPTHAARQLGPDKWSSKLGSWYDIEHSEKSIAGGDYGDVVLYMQRPKRS